MSRDGYLPDDVSHDAIERAAPQSDEDAPHPCEVLADVLRGGGALDRERIVLTLLDAADEIADLRLQRDELRCVRDQLRLRAEQAEAKLRRADLGVAYLDNLRALLVAQRDEARAIAQEWHRNWSQSGAEMRAAARVSP